MKLVRSFDIDSDDGARRLELLVGDLTNMPAEHAVDLLVVSAFPGDYTPTPNSLIGALDHVGVSLSQLAKSKAVDLRGSFGCWLSEEIKPTPTLPYRRILCFEPTTSDRASELVGDIFRALEPFAFGPPNLQSVAMPFLATGDQLQDIWQMSQAIFEAARSRLSNGYPIKIIKVVVRDEAIAAEAAKLFQMLHTRSSHIAFSVDRQMDIPRRYDVFISYSRRDQDIARVIHSVLKEAGIVSFFDEKDIAAGASWQQEIFDAMESCKRAIMLYSPEFITSRVCKDEFSQAKIIRRRRDENFIFPLFVRGSELPAYLEMINYSDCRVADADKATAAVIKLAGEITGS